MDEHKKKSLVGETEREADHALHTLKALASAKVEVPDVSMDHALSIFAYHIACISTNTGKFGLHFYGDVSVQFEIKPVQDDPDGSVQYNRAWDQVLMDGKQVGNRSAAREAYAKLCSPVIALIGSRQE